MAFSVYLSLPSILLMIQNDEDSQRLVELYHQYKRLMFKVSQQYFPHDHHEMEDGYAYRICIISGCSILMPLSPKMHRDSRPQRC